MTASPLPIIGITPSRKIDPEGGNTIYAPETYIRAVAEAGGAPLMIPLGLSEAALSAVLTGLDGVLFSGGGDVHPDRYGGSMHPKVDYVDPDRDRVELFLFAETTRRRLPFLGICRGFQVINVALGGTLYEDILDQHPGGLDHRRQSPQSSAKLVHTVEVQPDSCLGAILEGGTVKVNSLHHQGVRVLAPGLQVSAAAPDGIIEAYELPGYPFGLAVQWHPEWLTDQPGMRRLFRAFNEAAGKTSRS